MRVPIGLIGAGRMGATLGKLLAFSIEDARIAAVADPDGEQAAKVAQSCQVADLYTDYQELLARDDLDAVVIATPTNTHTEVIKAAAAAGKHIFAEKPLALTLDGCDEAIAAVEAAGVKLHVGFMRRFDSAYMAAKKKISSGDIGEPMVFKAVGRDTWRPTVAFARRENSGGLLLDMGIHDFDLARWLMGSDVIRVYSEGDCLLYPELKQAGDIDNAVVTLRFASGAVGDVEMSRSGLYGYDIRTEVVGSEGSLIIGSLQQTSVMVLSGNSVSHDTVSGFMDRFRDAYAAELRDFVSAILEDRDTAVGGLEARAATAIGVAATRSLDERRPVTLSEIE